MGKRLIYSTFQAARVLGVSPDTVLKWIKSGKIPAGRTLGGHYRIRGDTIAELISKGAFAHPATKTAAPRKPFRYCWEFHSTNGTPKDGCKDCLAYKTRARLCYELSSVPRELGHLKLFCDSECKDCDYYRYIREHSATVLVITDNPQFLGDLRDSDSVSLKITNCETECSAVVERIRPELAVIDCSCHKSKDCYNYLTDDPRNADVGIILASDTEIPFDYGDDRIAGHVSKPLTIEKIEEYVTKTAR